MKKRIQELQTTIYELRTEFGEVERKWIATIINATLKETTDSAFKDMMDQHSNSIRSNQKKTG